MKKQIRKTSILLLNLFMFTQVSFAERIDAGTAFDNFEIEIKYIASGFSGIALLTSILIFIVHLVRLANAPNHPIQRKKLMSDIMISGVCTALLGAVNIVVFIIFKTVAG